MTACGGGGGADNDAGNGGDNGRTAVTPPLSLTDSNALDAAEYALRPMEEALVSASIAFNAAGRLAQNANPATLTCGPGITTPLTQSYEDRDESTSVTVGDVVRYRHGECAGIRSDLTLTLTDLQAGNIAGRLELDNTVDGFSVAGELVASGTWTAATSQTRWRASNMRLAVTSGGTLQTVRADHAELIIAPTSYEFSVAGGSVDSAALGGVYAFSTPTPLRGERRRLPTLGALELTSSSGSRASIVPPSARTLGEATVEYMAAAPGSAYGAPRRGLWTNLVHGWLFEWTPNSPPVINGLSLQSSSSPTIAVYALFNLSDPDADSLTSDVTWRVNGVVVAHGPTLTAPLVRNDLVEATVSVTDGRVEMPIASTVSMVFGNRPPSLTSLRLSPDLPDTTADLVAIATATDPDNDVLRASYVWRREGVVIADQTTAVLPASETTRGDRISVTVTFDDDGLSITGSAVTTIGDAPARVVVSSPDTSATYGMPVEFTASVVDPDGDPVGQVLYELHHGPPGMTVDAASGRVSWTPTGPMFDRTQDVSWGVTVNVERAQPGIGTIHVNDPTRAYPLLRTGIQIPLPNSLRVGDFDGDNDMEMLLLGQRWLLEIEADGTGGYRQSWAHPFMFDADDLHFDLAFIADRTMTTGDVDGDRHHEIFVTTAHRLVKLDGIERRVVASAAMGTTEHCTDVEFGDLDRDGAAEVVCAAVTGQNSERIIVYRASDLAVRATLPPGAYGTTLALGNLDTDAALEIVTSGGYVIDGSSTAVQWHHTPGFGRFSLGNIDGSGVDEIVATELGELVAYRANAPTPLFRVSGDPDTVFVADIDGDGHREILTGDRYAGNVTAYRFNASSGTINMIFRIDSQESGVSAIGVGDLDRDSELEIVWGSGLGTYNAHKIVVAGQNPGIEIEWTNTDPTQLVGPFIGGALARSPLDAAAPLFVTTAADGYADAASRAVRLDPVSGMIEIGPPLSPPNDGWFEIAATDDYDADGTDELLLASVNPSTPTIYDFYSDTVEWQSGSREPDVRLASGNVYGDARKEIVWLSWYGVTVLDAATRQVIWFSNQLPRPRGLRLADLDGNGVAEVIVANHQSMHIFSEAPTPGLHSPAESITLPGNVFDVAVGDTDGDGGLEIFLLIGGSSPEHRSIVMPFDSDRRAQPPFELPWTVESVAIEPSSFGRKNLLVTRREANTGRLITVDSRNGAVVTQSPPLIGAIGRDSVHYVDFGSGQPRISIGTEGGMYLTR